MLENLKADVLGSIDTWRLSNFLMVLYREQYLLEWKNEILVHFSVFVSVDA